MNESPHTKMDQVTSAIAELLEIHPELKKYLDVSDKTSLPSQFAKKKSKVRGFVVESAPSVSRAVIERHIEELVVLSEGRPSILIKDNDFSLDEHESLPNVFLEILGAHRDEIGNAIRGVGRIEVWNHPRRSWLGTGFIVAAPDGSNIVVTNRHVADEMAYRRALGGYQFVESMVGEGPISASLDMKEEAVSVPLQRIASVPIVEVLHIEGPEGPDLAFLRLSEPSSDIEPSRLEFDQEIQEKTPIAAIGYPAKDTRETSLEMVQQLLGDVFNKKRMSPGVIKSVADSRLTHDCSTLGGNSGSPLVDLRSGLVVGLHYGGSFPNPQNLAVPAGVVVERIEQVFRQRRSGTSARDQGNPTDGAIVEHVQSVSQALENGVVSVEIPLRVTFEIGQQLATNKGQNRESESSIADNVLAIKNRFASLPGVVNVRSGMRFSNGIYTSDPVVVVLIDHTVAGSEAALAELPDSIGNFAVQVRAASAEDIILASNARALVSLEGVPRINYVRPPNLSLEPVDEEMFAVFHVSPDAGWPQLKEFLSRTRKSLTIGLYNFATEHVEAELRSAIARSPNTLDLVLGDAGLDREHTDGFEDQFVSTFQQLMGDRFRYELADGQRRLFAGHYHIKVAVRDSRALWLSSGNWEPSNQPEVDPIKDGETSWNLLRKKNREWHAVVLNDSLAQTYESYIKYDLESYRALRTAVREFPPGPPVPLVLVPKSASVDEDLPSSARYFSPLIVRKRLRIQPLLTPDNFMEHVLPLIQTATESIDLQNQTLKWRDQRVDDRFEEFMQTLLEKHRSGVRVRMILRSDYSPEMKEMLIGHGFEQDQIRMLSRCHTKGMVVDSRSTLLGSHNLSEHGAFVNRDASLIIEDNQVAEYFSEIFQFDWERASRRVRETPPGIRRYYPGVPVPTEYEVVSLFDVVY